MPLIYAYIKKTENKVIKAGLGYTIGNIPKF